MPGLSAQIKQQIAADLAGAAHGERGTLAKRLAAQFGVSLATIYRCAGRQGKPRPRAAAKPQYREWVRVAVALVHQAPKGLPLDLAIAAGVEAGLLPAEAGAMPLQTAYRIARAMGLRDRPRRTHRLHADYPMQAVQIDGSTSEYLVVDKILPDGDYRLKLHRKPTPASGYKNKPLGPDRLRVQVYALWDMCTGYQLARYAVAKGENALDAMDFLCWALGEEKDIRIPLHGVPDDLWTDQGPLFKSGPACELLERLDIHLVTGEAYAKERMGGVERSHRTRWNRFEQSLFLRAQDSLTLSELNGRLVEFTVAENARHRSRTPVAGRATDRAAAWVALVNGRDKPLRQLPPNALATMAREVRRWVDNNGILRWDGVEYALERLHSQWVIARRAMDDTNNVVVEDDSGQRHTARPYQARPYGEIIAAAKSPLERLKDEPPGLAGVDLYAPSSSASDRPGVFSMPTRSRQAAALDNPLDASRYASLDDAMQAFSAIYPCALGANRAAVVERITAAGLKKNAVRDLAQDLNGLLKTGAQ